MSWVPVKHKALTYERLKEFLQNTEYSGVTPETEIKLLSPPNNKQCLRKNFFTLDNFNYVHSNNDRGIYIKKYSVGSSEENASAYNENLIVIEPDIAYYMPNTPLPTPEWNIYILTLDNTTYNGEKIETSTIKATVKDGRNWESGLFAPPSGQENNGTLIVKEGSVSLQLSSNKVTLNNIHEHHYLVSSFTETKLYTITIIPDANSKYENHAFNETVIIYVSEGSNWESNLRDKLSYNTGYQLKNITYTPSEKVTENNGTYSITDIRNNYEFVITTEAITSPSDIDISIKKLSGECFDITETPKYKDDFVFIDGNGTELSEGLFKYGTERVEGNYYFTINTDSATQIPTLYSGTYWQGSLWKINVYWNGKWHNFTDSKLCINTYYSVGFLNQSDISYDIPLGGLSPTELNTIQITSTNNKKLQRIVVYLGGSSPASNEIPSSRPGIIILPAGQDTVIINKEGLETHYNPNSPVAIESIQLTINSINEETCELSISGVNEGVMVKAYSSTVSYWRTHCTVTKILKSGVDLVDSNSVLVGREIAYFTDDPISETLFDIYWKSGLIATDNYEQESDNFENYILQLLDLQDDESYSWLIVCDESNNNCTNCIIKFEVGSSPGPGPGPGGDDDCEYISLDMKENNTLHEGYYTIHLTCNGISEWTNYTYEYAKNYNFSTDKIITKFLLVKTEDGEEVVIHDYLDKSEDFIISQEIFEPYVNNDISKYCIVVEDFSKDEPTGFDEYDPNCTIKIDEQVAAQGTAGGISTNTIQLASTDNVNYSVNYKYCEHPEYYKEGIPYSTEVSGDNQITIAVRRCGDVGNLSVNINITN